MTELMSFQVRSNNFIITGCERPVSLKQGSRPVADDFWTMAVDTQWDGSTLKALCSKGLTSK